MAGHSKWANIKHRKGTQDKKRAKIFTRILKEVHVAVKEGGGADPDSNPRLRLAIQNAKGTNISKDTLERAISKASGAGSESYQEVSYEGYLPNGIAVFVECSTDNLNRTVSHVRSIYSKYGGELGTNGSLEFIFDRKGVFVLEMNKISGQELEELEMDLIDHGLQEAEQNDEMLVLYCSYEDFGSLNAALEEKGLEVQSADLQRIPNSTIDVRIDQAKTALNAIETFEDDDDVQNVYHNMKLTDELVEQLELS